METSRGLGQEPEAVVRKGHRDRDGWVLQGHLRACIDPRGTEYPLDPVGVVAHAPVGSIPLLEAWVGERDRRP